MAALCPMPKCRFNTKNIGTGTTSPLIPSGALLVKLDWIALVGCTLLEIGSC